MATNPAFLITCYLLWWWMAFFCVLPIGVRGQHEDGELAPGHDTGAPVVPNLRKKIIWASLLALVFWAVTVAVVFFDPIRIRS
jgi:predicted secreted protein